MAEEGRDRRARTVGWPELLAGQGAGGPESTKAGENLEIVDLLVLVRAPVIGKQVKGHSRCARRRYGLPPVTGKQVCGFSDDFFSPFRVILSSGSRK